MKIFNKKKNYLYAILFIFLIAGFIYIGTRDYNIPKDDEKNINRKLETPAVDGIYSYAYSSIVYSAIKSGDCIVLFGFNDNEFIGKYASIVSEVAQSKGIDKILYYDFLEDRNNNNATYESIVNYLSDYLYKDDLGNTNLVSPSLLIIKDGEIFYYDDETSRVLTYVTSKSYWNDYNLALKQVELANVFDKYLEDNNGK